MASKKELKEIVKSIMQDYPMQDILLVMSNECLRIAKDLDTTKDGKKSWGILAQYLVNPTLL
jgi:hypothetical protein